MVKCLAYLGNGQVEFHEFVKALQHQGRGYKQPRRIDSYDDEHLRQAFQIFDTDRDGFIRKEEMKETVKHLSLEAQLTDAVIDEMFRSADTNNDKLLSLEGKLKLTRFKRAEISFFRLITFVFYWSLSLTKNFQNMRRLSKGTEAISHSVGARNSQTNCLWANVLNWAYLPAMNHSILGICFRQLHSIFNTFIFHILFIIIRWINFQIIKLNLTNEYL